MNRTQAQNRAGEIVGKLYWHERGTFLVENAAELRAELDELRAGLEANRFPLETDAHGCTIERSTGAGSRYYYDFKACRPEDGWEQYDTRRDAAYFGIWVNLEQRVILTYAEGDLTRVTAPDDDALRAELAELEQTYGPPPPAFTVLSLNNDGNLTGITEIYDERPTL